MPFDEEWKEWVFEALRDLTERCGALPLLTAPILEPTDEHFPDALDPGAVGVRTLVRRMMRYAGLGDLHVGLAIMEGEDADEPASPVIFSEIDGQNALFGMYEEGSREALLGFLCFEMGHAFRASRKLGETASPYRDHITLDPAVMEQLAAVTAVYLGFGLLAANAAHTYEAGGTLDGSMAHTYWQHSFAGGLPGDALAWLLALQTVVRGQDAKSLDRLRKRLQPNPRAAFEAAREELQTERAWLIEELGLPPHDEWPAPQKPDTTLLLVEEADAELAEEEEARDDVRSAHYERHRRRRIVYRVRERASRVGTLYTTMVAGIVSFGVLAAVGVSPLGFVVALGAAGALMLIYMKLNDVVRCSDTECQTRIPEGVEACPGCDLRIVGEVASRREALDLPRYPDPDD